MAFETEKQARSIGEARKIEEKNEQNKSNSVSLDDLFAKIQDGTKEINVIIKADVNGSAEAVKNSLEKIEVEDVKESKKTKAVVSFLIIMQLIMTLLYHRLCQTI